jgi:lysyl-tRNA synthetase class 2
VDNKLIAAIKHGLPECSGVALGLDRLLMILADASKIDKVLSFTPEG